MDLDNPVILTYAIQRAVRASRNYRHKSDRLSLQNQAVLSQIGKLGNFLLPERWKFIQAGVDSHSIMIRNYSIIIMSLQRQRPQSEH